jgi:hypothetical protein
MRFKNTPAYPVFAPIFDRTHSRRKTDGRAGISFSPGKKTFFFVIIPYHGKIS